MNAQEAIGYLASLPVLAAFGVCGMVALRPPAIAGNLAFIAHAALAGMNPVLLLQAQLLPVDLCRLLLALHERPSRVKSV